jgi:hypothetical protein
VGVSRAKPMQVARKFGGPRNELVHVVQQGRNI